MVKEIMNKSGPSRMMDQQELSPGSSLSTEFDASNYRKRKHSWVETRTQISIDLLQLNEPLPLDWEQFLDLQSGRIYYMNKRTMSKSWLRPKEQKLDLDLNFSTQLKPEEIKDEVATQDDPKRHRRLVENNMIAAPCSNCHLLVMLCRSSPSCPNCKFVHQLLPSPTVVKSLKTLSLLN